MIVTFDEEFQLEEQGLYIDAGPKWKWLLLQLFGFLSLCPDQSSKPRVRAKEDCQTLGTNAVSESEGTNKGAKEL